MEKDIVGKEILGMAIMALGGFFLTVAVAGEIFGMSYRLTVFFLGTIMFYFGAKYFKKNLENTTISTRDFLIMFLSMFTPFIVLILLDLLGFEWGGICIGIWVLSSIIIVVKRERIFDILFPKIERKPINERSEEMRRMLNPRLYSWQTQRKKEKT